MGSSMDVSFIPEVPKLCPLKHLWVVCGELEGQVVLSPSTLLQLLGHIEMRGPCAHKCSPQVTHPYSSAA